jgi:hypothetical protein
VDPLDVAALGGDSRAAVLQLQVLDVEVERLLRAGGRLIQQPPQAALAHGHAGPGQQTLERRLRERVRAVDRFASAAQRESAGGRRPGAVLAVAAEGAQRAEVAIPRRRRAGAPGGLDGALELARRKLAEQALAAEHAGEASERLGVGAPRGGGELGLGEEGVDRGQQRRPARRPWAGGEHSGGVHRGERAHGDRRLTRAGARRR